MSKFQTISSAITLTIVLGISQSSHSMGDPEERHFSRIQLAPAPVEVEPVNPQHSFVLDNPELTFDTKRGMFYSGPSLDQSATGQAAQQPSHVDVDTVTFTLAEETGPTAADLGPSGILAMGTMGPTSEGVSGGQSAEATKPAHNWDDMEPQKVLGDSDGRKWVQQYSQWPYRVHGHMVMKYPGGSRYIGSGTLINGDTVLTAGHNLFDRDTRTTPTSVEFYPGRDHGHIRWMSHAKAIHIHPSYFAEDNSAFRDFDMGVVRLTSPLGNYTGSFGMRILNDNATGMTINVTGYPGDLDGGKRMYTMGGPISEMTAERFFYNTIDTAGGQSGSGVWTIINGQPVVVGIHCYGGHDANSATRITHAKFKHIIKWASV